MIVLAKRIKILFAVSLAVLIVFVGGAIYLLNVTDDGSTVIPAIVLFSSSAVFILLGLFDLLRKPNALMLYCKEKKELLIYKNQNVAINKKLIIKNDSRYYVIPINEVLGIIINKKPKGGKVGGFLFGMLGYLLTVEKFNSIFIKLKDGNLSVKNIHSFNKIEKFIQEFNLNNLHESIQESEDENADIENKQNTDNSALCSECGYQFFEGDEICSNCGKKVFSPKNKIV